MKQTLTTNTGIATLLWVPVPETPDVIFDKEDNSVAYSHKVGDEWKYERIYLPLENEYKVIGLYHSITEEQAASIVSYHDGVPMDYIFDNLYYQTALDSLRSHKEANEIPDGNYLILIQK